MIMAIRNRLHKEEGGFTLIELMVVVLIIAILIAIAIPTFLNARKKAQRRQAQSTLRNALTTEESWYTDAQVYTVTVAELESEEQNLDYTPLASDNPNEVSVAFIGTDDQTIQMAAWSKSKDCYYIIKAPTVGTTYWKVQNGAQADCTAAATAADGTGLPAAKTAGW